MLNEGDVIETKNGKAEITFINGSIIEIGTNSTFELHNETKNEMQLNKGRIKAFIKKQLNIEPIKFRSLNAVLAVRGTEFIFSYDPYTNITQVDLNEGKLEITPIAGSVVNLNAGNTLIVNLDGTTNVNTLSLDQYASQSNDLNIATEVNSNSSSAGYIILVIIIVVAIAVLIYVFTRNKSDKKKI